jgi:DNA ligase-1
MQAFARLYEALDTTTSTRLKLEALSAYFEQAAPADASWAVYVLIGQRPKRLVGPATLRRWLNEECALPEWLVEETYASVGDLAETIALLLDNPTVRAADAASATWSETSLAGWFTDNILPLARLAEDEQQQRVKAWWRALPYRISFLLNKLLTGSLRVGVSRSLVTRALSETLARPRPEIERALIGTWEPTAAFWNALHEGRAGDHAAQPYPFYLASPLEGAAEALGAREEWLAEWKWDGIRGQIVRRCGQVELWSRGEEIITDRFPDIVEVARHLPEGTILDGEVVAWSEDHIMPFASLQRRIGRRRLTPGILKSIPARFIAYDLLEHESQDLRQQPLRQRRLTLQQLIASFAPTLLLSESLSDLNWSQLAVSRTQSRERGVEGLMLKHLDSAYGVGRQRGAWWKWKIEPLTFDGVLIYAAPGHGRRADLFTDYTFAVWQGETLLPVAKAYSGLTDEEILRLDGWIRAHTVEKFGPVRAVQPVHVFELAFEAIARSTRHKSGIALRFPRILRWRTDKPPREADTLASLQGLLGHGSPQSP